MSCLISYPFARTQKARPGPNFFFGYSATVLARCQCRSLHTHTQIVEGAPLLLNFNEWQQKGRLSQETESASTSTKASCVSNQSSGFLMWLLT